MYIRRYVITLVVAFALLAPSLVRADSEAMPRAYVTSDYFGRHYFKMIPGDEAYNYDTKGSGELYRVNAKGPDEKLWTTEGWYAFEVYLSVDGIYLVRMGNWPRGHKPSKGQLAIAFYKKANLLKVMIL